MVQLVCCECGDKIVKRGSNAKEELVDMSLLHDFVEKKHCIFVEEAADWRDAIRIGCKPLLADGTIDERYQEKVIEGVEKYGPYIVLLPGVAMPHFQQGSEGVYKTAIGFMKVKKPVFFVEGDPEKYANLFFTLASCNPTEHLANMSQLAKMLGDDDLLQDLMENVNNEDDLLRIADKYSLS